MKVSDYIVKYFEEQGINIIFGYIGGMVTHLVDSIGNNPNMQFIQTYHEQTASIAAEGYAKETGLFGVALSTSGPGATNMITGIADAFFDSIPVIYITGQVNTYEYKYNTKIRQLGFQETDVVSIVKPITKYAKFIDDPTIIKFELEKAVAIATSMRKGPVLLDIPMNVQRADIEISACSEYRNSIPKPIGIPNQLLESIVEKIATSKRPMILLGGGCQDSEAKNQINIFLQKTNIPFVSSLMGRGVVNEGYPNYLGMIGSYGNRCANIAISKTDLLIVLGSRIDTRQTGAKIDSFIPNSSIIHVDIDNDELESHRLNNRLKVNMSVSDFLSDMNKIVLPLEDHTTWYNYIKILKNKYNQNTEIERFISNKSPYRLFQTLNRIIVNPNTVYCVDIGQNQMWAAQTLQLDKGQSFITSGGLAPMGFAIPAAIGVAFADSHKSVIAITGDGGFHISLQSLLLISQYNLPIKVIIMNNYSLGLITQFQDLYFNGNKYATTKEHGYSTPDFNLIAQSYNLTFFSLSDDDLTNTKLMETILSSHNCIIEYKIFGHTTVSPKLEFDQPIYNVSPFLSPNELSNALNYPSES